MEHPRDRADRNSMARHAAMVAAEPSRYDASATATIAYPTAPVCGKCGRRGLLLDEIINKETFCCNAPVVQG